MNAANEQKIASLICSARNKFRELISEIEKKGYNVLVTSSHRSNESQKKLIAAGGSVKPAKPGKSLHNHGVAIDINLKKGDQLWKKATPKQEWVDTGIPKLAKDLGFRWGGEFNNNYDPVHFDMGNNYKVNELSELVSKGKESFSQQFSCFVEDTFGKFLKK